MSDMDAVEEFKPIIRAYALRTAGGNAQDFEDACQLGSMCVSKALGAFNPDLGDRYQYVVTRLAEELTVGRKALTQPEVFTDLPPMAAPEEDGWIPEEMFGDPDTAADWIPADEPELEEQAVDLAAYDEVLAIKRLSELDPLKILFNALRYMTQPLDPELPTMNPRLQLLVNHLRSITRLPADAPVRRMFVWLRLIDQPAIPGLEDDSPTWIFPQPERVIKPTVSQTVGVAVAPDAMQGVAVGAHPHPDTPFLGTPYALYEGDFDPNGIDADERGSGPSWRDVDGRPPASGEVAWPARGWYAGDNQNHGQPTDPRAARIVRLEELQSNSPTLVNLGKNEPGDADDIDFPELWAMALAEPEAQRALSQVHRAWGTTAVAHFEGLKAVQKVLDRNRDEYKAHYELELEEGHPQSWPLPGEWEARHEVHDFFARLPAPSKYSRQSRKAFCLAMLDGLGLKVANHAAWEAHKRTVVGLHGHYLKFGNGTLVPFAKVSEPWKLSLDISAQEVCALVRKTHPGNQQAERFAQALEKGRS